MAKAKVSVTVDPAKVEQARQLLQVASLSQLIDIAIDRLITDEQERRHVAGYLARPPDAGEAEWAGIERDPSSVADDVDWAQLYGVSSR